MVNNYLLLYKIAHAYYVDDLTQEQISKRLGISRPRISRLLEQARREKIVNITLNSPSGDAADNEHKIEQKYGLEEVVIVSVSDPQDPASVARDLGPAAAKCLVRRICGNEIVGVTWGTTIMALVDAMPSVVRPEVTIVQINGGLGSVEKPEHSTELVRRLSLKFGARFKLLPAPGIVSNRQTADALKSDKQISCTLKLAAKSDIAIVGMGVLASDSVLIRDGTILTRRDSRMLKKAGAVGNIALRYIDKTGILLDMEINERIIGLTLEQIKHIPRVIAIAGGEKKYGVICAALKGKIPDILVTDHITAKKLLEEKG